MKQDRAVAGVENASAQGQLAVENIGRYRKHNRT